MAGNNDKMKALQLTLDRLDKTDGKGTVMKLGAEAVEKVDSIPSGSLNLDLALGIGGYPRGRVVEIYGPESSGKTTPWADCARIKSAGKSTRRGGNAGPEPCIILS